MAAGTEEPGSGVCVVCAKAVSSPTINVHSSLIAQNGSIHSQMVQVVGVEQLEEACRATELVCSICLRLLLSIVNLECKLVILKNEFRDTFMQGTKSRRGTQAGGQSHATAQSSVPDRKSAEGDTPQAEVWDSSHFDHCVRPEKVDSFFSNIPSASENNAECVKNTEPHDDKPEDPVIPVKHEASSPESSATTSQQCPDELGTHLALDTSTADLSDLLPSQCLLGDDAASCSSHGEEEASVEEGKRSDCDTYMQESKDSPPNTDSTMGPTKITGCDGEAEKACSTDATQEKQELPDPGGDNIKGVTAQPAQRRVRKHRGKEDRDMLPHSKVS